jgi:hypothetical protein
MRVGCPKLLAFYIDRWFWDCWERKEVLKRVMRKVGKKRSIYFQKEYVSQRHIGIEGRRSN